MQPFQQSMNGANHAMNVGRKAVSSPMRRSGAAFKCAACAGCMALVATSCTNPTPVAPTTQVGAPAPVRQAVRLTGRVTDEQGVPVSGTSVTVYDPPLGSTVTDQNGFYDLALASFPLLIRAERQGFEPTLERVSFPLEGSVSQNLRLYPIVRLVAGASWRVTITHESSWANGGDFRSRTVRLVLPQRSTVTLDVVDDDPARPNGWVSIFPVPDDWRASLFNSHASFSVAAAVELPVTILSLSYGSSPWSQSLTLNTAFEPR
jgi:Carboxypeptidase regulatory-like domain